MMTATVFIHVFSGGPEVYAPIRASTLDPTLRSILSVIWQAITMILALFAIGLFWITRHHAPALAAFLIAAQIGFAMLFIGYGLADLKTLMPMPQWIIFGAITGVVIVGQLRSNRSPAKS